MTTASTRRGWSVLEQIARALSDDVWVVAPETDQSGLSHSLSLNDPLRLREVNDRKFALRGTPSDCVIMAVRRLLGGKPDLVLSGVNSGQNVADDVTYSGTVAGAFEGTLLGIPSIALSQAYTFEDGVRTIPWETAATHAPGHHPEARRLRLPAGDRLQHQLPQPHARRGRRRRDHDAGAARPTAFTSTRGSTDAATRISGSPTGASGRTSRRAPTSMPCRTARSR